LRQEQGHLGENIADGDWLDVGGFLHSCLVRGDNAILSLGEDEIFFEELVPDKFVNAERISRRWGKEIDDQDVNTISRSAVRLPGEMSSITATIRPV
jgi:hypothetical protein